MRDPGEPGLVRLTSLVGGPGSAVPGGPAGRLRDLVVDLSRSPVPVTGALTGDAPSRRPPVLAPHEVRLVRDVLDCRVYDVPGRRTVRVGEVWLVRRDDGGLDVVGLEVGVAAVLRRLGLSRLRSAPEGLPLLQLSQVHLTSPPGHRAQLATPSAPVHRLGPHDLAHLLTHLPVSFAEDVVRLLPQERSRAAFERLHPRVVARLAHTLDGREAPPRRHRTRRTAGWRLDRPGTPFGSRGGRHR